MDAPPRPVGGGVAGGLGGGGFGGGPAGFGGGPPNSDQVWEAMVKGKDKIDLSDPENKPVLDRVNQRYPGLPTEGMLTREKFKEAVEKRMAESNPSGGGFNPLAFGSATAAAPSATYYLKRAKN